MTENAIQFIMEYYRASREVVLECYWDEVEAYMRLTSMKVNTND